MQVILTPTAVADLFGPGLNGFADSVPGPPTELSAEWFNSVQMEIVNVLLGQGIVLDGLQFNQLALALDDYTFVNPNVSGTLTMLDGSVLFVEAAGSIQSLGPITAGNVEAEKLVVPGVFDADGGVGTLEITVPASVSDTITMVSGADIVGTPGSTLSSFSSVAASILDTTSTGVALIKTAVFYQSTPASSLNGRVSWDGYRLTLGDGISARSLAAPLRSAVASVSTAAAIADTGASITIDMLTGQTVWANYTSEVTSNTAGLTIALRIEANATIIGGSAGRRIAVGATGEFVTFQREVSYTAAVDGPVTFKARHGALGGGTTTSENVVLTITR